MNQAEKQKLGVFQRVFKNATVGESHSDSQKKLTRKRERWHFPAGLKTVLAFSLVWAALWMRPAKVGSSTRDAELAK